MNEPITRSSDDDRPVWERHLQSIMIAMILMVLGWMGAQIVGQIKLQTEMNKDITFLTSQVAELKEGTKSRYTSEDAARDFRIRDAQILDLQERLRDREK